MKKNSKVGFWRSDRMKRFSLVFLTFAIVFGSVLIEAQNVAQDVPSTAPVPSVTPFPEVKNSSDAILAPRKHTPVSPQKSEKQLPSEHIKIFPSVPTHGKGNNDVFRGETNRMPDQARIIDQTIRDQLKALNEGDPSLAYYGFGSDEFKKNVSLETFRQFVATNRILSVHRTIEIEKPIFKGIVAKVKVKLASGIESVRLEYEFVQENGGWKVNRLDIFRNGS